MTGVRHRWSMSAILCLVGVVVVVLSTNVETPEGTTNRLVHVINIVCNPKEDPPAARERGDGAVERSGGDVATREQPAAWGGTQDRGVRERSFGDGAALEQSSSVGGIRDGGTTKEQAAEPPRAGGGHQSGGMVGVVDVNNDIRSVAVYSILMFHDPGAKPKDWSRVDRQPIQLSTAETKMSYIVGFMDCTIEGRWVATPRRKEGAWAEVTVCLGPECATSKPARVEDWRGPVAQAKDDSGRICAGGVRFGFADPVFAL